MFVRELRVSYEPSAIKADDQPVNTRIKEAASIIGVDVLDFMIIGNGRYFSFQETGIV